MVTQKEEGKREKKYPSRFGDEKRGGRKEKEESIAVW
ncbi:hypothetical protein AJ85_02770 [Alkalihalobacillus alcalophilus ATCC 27647 = CGMCC 1.3604]|uniref:Uncharacterized protein n=1 Tax=Alkalihalobacillus alcalophilus ATCC 27647 = CGMCC 1.3604 TaxID=1218173 RepID=A0A4S4JTY7_ALKAL|nr:hypothetical protein AJ85_02770 [Alkalihalobacillus alcalophilus ATCC 27647 = CGMCC 1.3604]